MNQVPEMNETEAKSYRRFIILLRILAAAAILFVLFILYAFFLDSRIYMGISRHNALKTINASDAVYINIKKNRTKVSDDDFEALKLIFQTIQCDAEGDGRGVKWGCGFTHDFSIEFVDNDTGKSVYLDKACDGCGWYTIDYNGYYFSDFDDYEKISDITEKYGMRDSLYSSTVHLENEKS